MNFKLLNTSWYTFLLTISFMAMSLKIVTRHDKNDKEYIALGNQFKAVCKVGMRGGVATLIAPQWVITAAHVAEGMIRREGGQLRIYFENEKEGIPVESIYIPEDYQPMERSDIALIKLTRKVTSIKPLNLFEGDSEKGSSIIIVGYGDTKKGNERDWTSDGLRRAATNLIDDANANYLIFDFDDPASADVTYLEGVSGRGDSGGPALIKEDNEFKVAGISSAGMDGKFGPATYGTIEYYTRVSNKVNWLKDVMSGKIPAYEPNQETTMKQTPQEREPDVFRGLGLILSERNGKIVIQGKIDPELPKEFRNVLFKPPSFILRLNNESLSSLEELTNVFNKIKSGEKYLIEFSVGGRILSFDVKR